MNVLIACHNKLAHVSLLIDANNAPTQVDYININHGADDNQYNDWSKVPEDFYDVVWMMHCPIYPPFVLANVPASEIDTVPGDLSIINNSWKVLKVGGILVIPFKDTTFPRPPLEEIRERAEKVIVGEVLKTPWDVELVQIKICR